MPWDDGTRADLMNKNRRNQLYTRGFRHDTNARICTRCIRLDLDPRNRFGPTFPGDVVNTPAPVALGYVSAREDALDAQREAIVKHARTEGYALAQIVTDRFDGHTISQLVEAARRHDARAVIVPAATTLATAHTHLAHELEPLGAICLLIDEPATTAVAPETTPAPRLTDALRRTPRHAARTHT